MKKYLVAFAILSATLFAVSAAYAQPQSSKLVIGAKLMVNRDVTIPADGLFLTKSEWCEELSGIRGKGVVQVRLKDLSKVEGKASVLKAGSFYELVHNELDFDLKFKNLGDAQDEIVISAVNWKGECTLPYKSMIEGLQAIGIRVRNSAY